MAHLTGWAIVGFSGDLIISDASGQAEIWGTKWQAEQRVIALGESHEGQPLRVEEIKIR
jgi:hypothetical protein